MKILTHNGLLVIGIPKTACATHVLDNQIVWTTDAGDGVTIPIGQGWNVLGYAGIDNISFDVEPYVDKTNDGNYVDYLHNWLFFSNKNKSFISLLRKNGIQVKTENKYLVLGLGKDKL